MGVMIMITTAAVAVAAVRPAGDRLRGGIQGHRMACGPVEANARGGRQTDYLT